MGRGFCLAGHVLHQVQTTRFRESLGEIPGRRYDVQERVDALGHMGQLAAICR